MYWAQPWWYRRHRRLVPLTSEEAPKVIERLERLREHAEVGPVTWLQQPLNFAPSAFAFGRFRRRIVAVSGGAVVFQNRNLEAGKEIEQAILDGAAQIATPALVSTLAICIVFVPMFFLSGVAKYLFVPMAEAVVFAMLASYLLSRTVVPTMARYLLHEHDEAEAEKRAPQPQPLHPIPARLRIALREFASAISAS